MISQQSPSRFPHTCQTIFPDPETRVVGPVAHCGRLCCRLVIWGTALLRPIHIPCSPVNADSSPVGMVTEV